MAGALDGIRVLDLTHAIAGPYCTQLMADMGADVIRVEEPATAPNRRRGFTPPPRDPTLPQISISAFFVQHNRHKRSLTLDMKHPAGMAVMAGLVRVSDVVLESFLPRTRAKLGFDYEWARELNPGIIWGTMSSYGRTGPEADRGGFDFIVQARTGIMSITGEPDGPPMKSGISLVDYLAGLHMSTALLGALHHRQRTGQGQLVDVSLFDSAASCLDGLPIFVTAMGGKPGRVGNFYPIIRPPGYTIYRCKDGDLAMGASKGPLWARLAHVIGRPDMTPEPDTAEVEAWEAHVAEGVREVARWAAQYTRAEAMAILDAAGVPCDRVQTVNELMEDPLIEARGIVAEYRFNPLGTVRTIANPLHFSETPVTFGDRVPDPGEDNWDILTGVLGYSDDRAADVIASGVTESYATEGP